MPFSKEVQQVLDEIRAMPATVAKDVDIPMRTFLQIAASVCERALRDAKELAKCNYDTAKITKIRLLIELLRELSALYTDVQFDQTETRIDRDKVYTVLKDMLIELNRVGRYTFRHDPVRAENYSIAYYSRKRKAKEAKPTAQTA